MPRLAPLLAVGLLAGASVLVPAAPASAGSDPVYVVDVGNDELDVPPGADDLSLREAMQLANTDNAPSTIQLEPGTTYDLTRCGPPDSQEDLNSDGDLDHAPGFNHLLFVDGNGSTIRQTCPGERVLHHQPSSDLEVLHVTITGGDADGSGGGIRVNGSGGRLVTGDVSVVGNRASGTGGGIDNIGNDTLLIDTTVADNTAADVGGGVHSPGSSDLFLLRSTISHNTAGLSGGGVYASSPEATDSTLVANRVVPVEGAAFGANIFANGGATLEGTVVALGSGGVDCATFGTNVSQGGNVTFDDSCVNGGGDVFALHPQLGALADNGGPTQTHRAAFGSPVFDVIPFLDCASSSDQRGEPRPQPDEGACDAGSVEAPAAACTPPEFPDVSTSHPFFTDVCWMDQMAITTGFPDGRFQPSSAVTRQSMAAFIYRFALAPPFDPPTTPSFEDVGSSHPFSHEVEWLAQSGIAEGYQDGTYRPSAQVSRQAMAAFLFRIGGNDGYVAPLESSFSDVGLTSPFFREIHWTASDAAVSEGYADGTWRPAAPVSRQAMSAFLHRLAEVPSLQGV